MPKRLLESFGVLFASVFFISFLYEKFLAEKHFAQFVALIRAQLREMDNIQSTCVRLGIQEIFETRNDYESKYPLLHLISHVKPGGRVLVVARSMWHLLNKADAIKAALRKGGVLQLACISPSSIDKILAEISFLKKSDMKTPLEVLSDLLLWVQNEKPAGTIELRMYDQPLPDSMLYAELDNRNIIIWDLSFGRDLNQKRVLILEPTEGNLGNDVLSRYTTIWNLAKTQLKVESKGIIQIDDLATLISQYD